MDRAGRALLFCASRLKPAMARENPGESRSRMEGTFILCCSGNGGARRRNATAVTETRTGARVDWALLLPSGQVGAVCSLTCLAPHVINTSFEFAGPKA